MLQGIGCGSVGRAVRKDKNKEKRGWEWTMLKWDVASQMTGLIQTPFSEYGVITFYALL